MENMQITDLCVDLLKSIEIEVKYARKEKIQQDLKSNITHYFTWYSDGFGWETFVGDSDEEEDPGDPRHTIDSKSIRPSELSESRFEFYDYIKTGLFPAWKRGRTGKETIMEYVTMDVDSDYSDYSDDE